MRLDEFGNFPSDNENWIWSFAAQNEKKRRNRNVFGTFESNQKDNSHLTQLNVSRNDNMH